MALANWLISVDVLCNSAGFSAAMARMSVQARALGLQMQQAGLAGTNMAARTGNAMSGIIGKTNATAAAFGRLGAIADKALIGVGIASAAISIAGISSASQLQDSIANIGLATGKSSKAIDDAFTGTALNMSLATAQSVAQSMDILRVMAQSGLNDPAQLQKLAMPIAIYADTQYLTKGTPFDESAINASKIAHEFGARDADQLTPILNNLWKISQDMPDSMQNMQTQLKYFAARYIQAGVAPTEILKLQATMDRLGYGSGKSGTGLAQIYRNLLDPTLAQAKAQGALGISGYIGKNGVFDVEGMLNKLHQEYDASRKSGTGKAFDQQLNSAFSSNAGLIAGVLASDAGRQQYENVGKTLGRVKNMWDAQSQSMHTLSHQTVLLTSNFKSLAGFIWKPWMEQMTNAMASLANFVGNLAKWSEQHPDTSKIIAGGMTAAAAYAGARLAVILGGWVRLFERFPFLPKGVSATVGHHFGPISATAGGAGAAGAAAAKAARGGLPGVGDLLGLLAFPALRREFGSAGGWIAGLAMKIPGVSKAVAALTPILDAIGLKWFALRLNLAVAGEWLAKLGLRAIPFVGEILLAIDALSFLKDHVKDIGKAVGWIAGWLVKNMPSLFREAGILAVGLMKGLLAAIVGILDPRNWAKAVADFADGVRTGFAEANARALSDIDKRQLHFKPPAAPLVVQPKWAPTAQKPPGLPGIPSWAVTPPQPTDRRVRMRDVVVLPTPARATASATSTTHHHEGAVTINNHITVNGAGDPRKAAEMTGAAVAQAISRTGLHHSLPTGSGMGHAARSAAH
jgi:TP901 family phage tail tape measure protein